MKFDKLYNKIITEALRGRVLFKGPQGAEVKRRKGLISKERIAEIIKKFKAFKNKSTVCVNESMSLAKQQYVKTGKIPIETVKKLSTMDPTDSNKYLPWICKMYLTDRANIRRLREMLNSFDDKLNKGVIPANTNINKLKNIEELSDVLEQYSGRTRADVKRGIKSSDDVKKEDIVFENDKVLVLMPKNIQDAQKYGRKGKWCISAMGDRNYFEYYFYAMTCNIYIIIPKVDLNKLLPDSKYNLKSIAIPVDENDKFVELQDASNKLIPDDEFKKITKVLEIPF